MPTITPHLWFDKEAYEAAELYCSIFPNSRILGEDRFENTGPTGEDTVTVVNFEVLGQKVIGLNAGPEFKFNESFSFYVECDDQAEVDEYWGKLIANGGRESQCGWLKDRYGLSWQIIPKLLVELLNDEDKDAANRVMQAMLQMQKIDCDALQRAYEQPVNA
ncbi:MAG TPA: VOC family protein [Actinomycetota bacterium]|nr:VOC family protein [Actinomycetota bacterium]